MWCHKINFAHILPIPTWRRSLPNTWVVLEKKGGSRHFFLKRETCWTSFFPCHGLATVGGEQCNQPPWENIVVRPPLMTLDCIWRDVGGDDSQRTKRGGLPATLSVAGFLEIPREIARSTWKVVSLIIKLLVKTCICCPREWKIEELFFPLYWGKLRFGFCLGTNHKVRHLPAVILTLFFKVRPHVKPSHPWQGKPRVFLEEKLLQFEFSCRDLWSPL